MGSILTSCCDTTGLLPSGSLINKREHEIETSYIRTESARKILSFKDFKGFKKIHDIADYYQFYEMMGQGSFGEVWKAEHKKANVVCAIKIIKKSKI